MTSSKHKNLFKITKSDNVLKDKTFKIAINRKYIWYEKGLASMSRNIFDNTSIRRKVYSSF